MRMCKSLALHFEQKPVSNWKWLHLIIKWISMQWIHLNRSPFNAVGAPYVCGLQFPWIPASTADRNCSSWSSVFLAFRARVRLLLKMGFEWVPDLIPSRFYSLSHKWMAILWWPQCCQGMFWMGVDICERAWQHSKQAGAKQPAPLTLLCAYNTLSQTLDDTWACH